MNKSFLFFLFIILNTQVLAYKTKSMITWYYNEKDICMMEMKMELRKNKYTFYIDKKFGTDWSIYENNKKVGHVTLQEPNIFRKVWQFTFGEDTVKVSFADYKIEYDLTLYVSHQSYDILNLSRSCHSSFNLYPADSKYNEKPIVIGNAISPCELGNWEFVVKNKKISERVIACYMFSACIASDLVRLKAEERD